MERGSLRQQSHRLRRRRQSKRGERHRLAFLIDAISIQSTASPSPAALHSCPPPPRPPFFLFSTIPVHFSSLALLSASYFFGCQQGNTECAVWWERCACAASSFSASLSLLCWSIRLSVRFIFPRRSRVSLPPPSYGFIFRGRRPTDCTRARGEPHRMPSSKGSVRSGVNNSCINHQHHRWSPHRNRFPTRQTQPYHTPSSNTTMQPQPSLPSNPSHTSLYPAFLRDHQQRSPPCVSTSALRLRLRPLFPRLLCLRVSALPAAVVVRVCRRCWSCHRLQVTTDLCPLSSGPVA